MNFHDTQMGRNFFEHQLPQLIEAIQTLTAALDRPTQTITSAAHGRQYYYIFASAGYKGGDVTHSLRRPDGSASEFPASQKHWSRKVNQISHKTSISRLKM